ncbi:MAG: heme lyase CcmF/NrfE family subunit [Betaproteobacteria bacterium]|nr:heme lyase CcmF/NrfE family subunit [Betaproteobacteria bacterium]
MIPELGHFAIILALVLAIAQGIVPLVGAGTGDRGNALLMNLARPLAQGQFVFVAFAFACLMYSFYVNDFSVANVAQNSNSKLPWYYRLTASWGSHEGSMLLWTLMMAGWTFAVSVFSRNLPIQMVARVIGVMGLASVGFLLFILLTSNPFDRLLPAAPDGRDLNPLLQDPGMIIHPPMLYMGYVGFSVAFAFAVAALIGGKLDATWARWSRPWTTTAWCFLTIGIALGSWWAYYELGWGGWWFWDPVENASFMPWLVGTALIHSLAVTEKRGTFKSWTVLLAIMAFSLSLLGTFLVRSGVLTSVHAFATDPKRGVFILGFLVVVIGSSLALYAWRAPKVGLGAKFSALSRESLLLANNVVLVVAMAAVMLGTLYPLFLDALNMGKISVGPPYFDAVFYPLMAPALFLIGVGPIAQWREAKLPDLWQRLKWALAVGVIAALILPFVMGTWMPLVALGLFFALWIFITTGMALRHRFMQSPQSGFWRKVAASTPSYYGMHLAHIGVAVFVIGVTLVRGYEVEKDVRMAPGDSAELRGLSFKFVGVKDVQGPNYNAVRGTVEVYSGTSLREVMHPEKRMYFASGQTMTEADIDSGLVRDIYVSLGEPVQGATDGAWSLRLYVKPFIDWIWGGCFLMALGGFLAIADRRYRIKVKREAVALPPGAPPADPGRPAAPAGAPAPRHGRRKHRRGGSPATAKA